jgi:general secretion pathway protein K
LRRRAERCRIGGRQRGFVLALTVLTLAIIAVVLGYLFERAQAELALAQARNARLQAQLGMIDTRAELIFRLLTNPMTFEGLGAGANAIGLDDRLYRGARGTLVSLQDARGLLNLNFTPDERLHRFLRGLGIEPLQASALVDTLRDYTDEDDLRRLNGAEAADYAAASLPPPRNAPLATPQDLHKVIGWRDQPQLWGAKPVESLATTARLLGFNPNTAPYEVLLSVPGVTTESAAALLELRRSQTIFERQFMQFGGAEASSMFFPVLPLPGETLRITQYAPGARWAMRYSVTLTARDAVGPWRIDYAYRIARPELPPDFDEDKLPGLPGRLSTPAEEMPDLSAAFGGR